MKIAATAMGAIALGMLSTTSTANADKAIDNNHVRVEAGYRQQSRASRSR